MIKLPQKIVAVIGKESKVLFKCVNEITIIESSDIAEYLRHEVLDEGTYLYFKGIKKGRGIIKVSINENEYEVPIVTFNDKEFFVSMVISSNNHLGQDPENCIRGCEHEILHDVSGHGFFKTCRTLEPNYHKFNLPITWLIDEVVAEDGNSILKDFHKRYGDDYGLMPSSYFHHNGQNYNIEKSQEEVNEIIKDSLVNLENQFDTYTSILGIDQWIGSVGSKFVKACEHVGLKGIWGLGYDHYTCDTSMFHRGCPWDMYKPDRDNIKLPCKYPSDLWAFQWTTRDIVNTVHTPDGKSSGSVIFATDPDDIAATGIMNAQKDYYEKMLKEYKRGLGSGDFFVFLMHQEDHESHNEHDNIYMDNFLKNIIKEPDITFATLVEIEQWLNIIYPKEEHPTQALILDDILTCKDDVIWERVKKPKDWRTFNTHFAVYNDKIQVFFEKPNQKPFRVYDYEKNYLINEIDSYPEEQYSENIEIISTEIKDGQCNIRIYSDEIYTNYPIAIWDVPKGLKSRVESNLIVNENCIVILVDLEKGDNQFKIQI